MTFNSCINLTSKNEGIGETWQICSLQWVKTLWSFCQVLQDSFVNTHFCRAALFLPKLSKNVLQSLWMTSMHHVHQIRMLSADPILYPTCAHLVWTSAPNQHNLQVLGALSSLIVLVVCFGSNLPLNSSTQQTSQLVSHPH